MSREVEEAPLTPAEMAELSQIIETYMRQRSKGDAVVNVSEVVVEQVHLKPPHTFWQRHPSTRLLVSIFVNTFLTLAFWLGIWMHNIAAIVVALFIIVIWRVKHRDLLY
jgi:hypothetical protein